MNPSFHRTLIILLSMALLLGPVVMVRADEEPMMEGFIDVAPTHPYYTAITQLAENEVIQGYPIGTFLPDRNVNRVEALKIILSSFPEDEGSHGGEIESQTGFTDTEPDAWYMPYLNEAVERGLVNGYEDGSFQPARNINLAEALKIIIETQEPDETFEELQLEVAPAHDVPSESWFAKYLQFALDHAMVYPDADNNLLPSHAITRGELTDLIYRLQYNDKYSGEIYRGNATYYHDKFQGRGTASGDIFDQEKFTAAHRTLPFGTQLRVTHRTTGKTIEVTVNDRGPYSDHAILDLSRSAFETIGSLGSGVIPVEIEVLYPSS